MVDLNVCSLNQANSLQIPTFRQTEAGLSLADLQDVHVSWQHVPTQAVQANLSQKVNGLPTWCPGDGCYLSYVEKTYSEVTDSFFDLQLERLFLLGG